MPMTDRLCPLEEIPDGTGRGFTLKSGAVGDPHGLDILVVRSGERVFGYVNCCPHARSPLDWTPDQFMSRDGRHIQCATHGALFEIETGRCIRGPCVGQCLTPVPLTVADGQVIDGQVIDGQVIDDRVIDPEL
jgi:nitrite reductase/ring-hydroxylating ferredoxin subunit